MAKKKKNKEVNCTKILDEKVEQITEEVIEEPAQEGYFAYDVERLEFKIDFVTLKSSFLVI